MEKLSSAIRIKANESVIDIYNNNIQDPGFAEKYDVIVISSGPYSPKESGISIRLVEKFFGKKPILGICLGHQIIGNYLGFKVRKSKNIIHGDIVDIRHFRFKFWDGIPCKIKVARYNSLVLTASARCLEKYISSLSEEKEVMSIESEEEKFLGVQFHPDSFLSSQYSHRLIKNFLNCYKR
jgi:para-aminobenzoate synthetase component 2